MGLPIVTGTGRQPLDCQSAEQAPTMLSKEELDQAIQRIIRDYLKAYDASPGLQTSAPFIPLLRLWLQNRERIMDDQDDHPVA